MPGSAIVTATLMGLERGTGARTHLRTFDRWLAGEGHISHVVTPFDASAWQVYPIFWLRRVVEHASPPWGVWCYRHSHAVLLRREVFGRAPAVAGRPYALVPNFVDRLAASSESQPQDGDLVSVGTLEPRKNQAYVLEILAALRARGRPLRLTLIGDGPDRPRLEPLARELQVDDLVRFAGHVCNAKERIPRHKAVIHSTIAENLPLVLLEVMVQGRPVFAGAVGGVGEVFSDGVEVRVIPLGAADAAAQIILDWWDRLGRIEAAGRAARDGFEHRFETSVVAARLARFLLEPTLSDG